ncbi:hypothetical protein [Streptomyces sp. NPDC014733]|uniref:hypothetical protein n=1 Tax=Streptomyces sp. NPDC014733 TaxID=3364885 RepID=UPI0036F61DE5
MTLPDGTRHTVVDVHDDYSTPGAPRVAIVFADRDRPYRVHAGTAVPVERP